MFDFLQKKNIKTAILIGFYLILSLFVLIPQLGWHVLVDWDEARQGVNAFEMYKTNNLIYTTFEFQPEHWNTKPPLLIWLQYICMHIFSSFEVAVRFPTVCSIILMGIGLIWLFNKIGRIYTGFFAAVICLCCDTLTYFHCFRSGDYDGMMISFMMLYLTCFFVYAKTNKQKYLILFFVFLILDTMTKGIQSLIPLPALAAYLLITKRFVIELKNKNVYIFSAIFLLIVLGYYFIRERFDNGYIQSVLDNEVFGRYSSAIEGHNGTKTYYWNLIKNDNFIFGIILFPLAVLLNYLLKNKDCKQITSFFLLNILFYFAVITLGQTKLPWYYFPILPMIAVMIAAGIDNILTSSLINKRKTVFAITFLAICCCFIYPYSNVVNNSFHAKTYRGDIQYFCGHYIMRDIAQNKLPYDNIYYLSDNDDNNQVSVFYWHLLKENNKNFYKINLDNIATGMLIQVNKEDNFKKIQDRFNIEELYSLNQARIIKIKDKKQ